MKIVYHDSDMGIKMRHNPPFVPMSAGKSKIMAINSHNITLDKNPIRMYDSSLP
jgi:hypothetical protein